MARKKKGKEKAFTAAQWKKINAELTRDPVKYGLPARRKGSAVLASFNIRKLGDEESRPDHIWKFLGRVCRRFDLLAVQEVMDELGGLRRLVKEMGSRYSFIVSDTTGTFPGDPGLNERLAFIYRTDVVTRANIVSDLTYDRSKVLKTLVENFAGFQKVLEPKHRAWRKKVDAIEKDFRRQETDFNSGRRRRPPKMKKLPSPPKYIPPAFLSFIRQPYSATFRILGTSPRAKPYEFMAVDAHLIFAKGNLTIRKQEFRALMEWIINYAKKSHDRPHPGVMLFGDLNLKFDRPKSDLAKIMKYAEEHRLVDVIDGRDTAGTGGPVVARFETGRGRSRQEFSVRFPFLEVHPELGKVLTTNARQNQTFDHIGVVYRTEKVPQAVREAAMSRRGVGPDFGVMDFVNLFANAVKGKDFDRMTAAQKKAFYPFFEHSVSDHMPIWLRVPRP